MSDPVDRLDPYRAPGASLEGGASLRRPAVVVASRWARLGGAIVEGVVTWILTLGAMFGLTAIGAVSGIGEMFRQSSPGLDSPVYLAQVGVALVVLVANLWLWHRYAQSIGKRVLGIRIVAKDGRPATLRRILLRQLPQIVAGFGVGLVSRDPLVIAFLGMALGVFALADVVAIFFPGSRCLHDLWAGTRVTVAGTDNDPDLVARA